VKDIKRKREKKKEKKKKKKGPPTMSSIRAKKTMKYKS
jgi:hypothetical protein